MSEKRKRTYDLDELKRLINSEKTRSITNTSIKNAHELGFSKTEIIETILALDNCNFYKSMTIHESSRIWQDVYKISKKNINLYIKLQKKADNSDIGVVVSFKRDEGGE